MNTTYPAHLVTGHYGFAEPSSAQRFLHTSKIFETFLHFVSVPMFAAERLSVLFLFLQIGVLDVDTRSVELSATQGSRSMREILVILH